MLHTLKTITVSFTALLFVASCTKEIKINPSTAKIEPGEAAGNAVITLTGSDLKNIQTITFDLGNVPAPFNPNFNTDGALVFRVPEDANPGDQNIIFKTKSGYQFSIPFKVLAVPTLTSSSINEWQAGDTIIIYGNYLGTTTNVIMTEDPTATVQVLSATTNELKIIMPSSAVKSTKIQVTNDAGSSTTLFTFYNVDLAYKIFIDTYYNGFGDGSWGDAGVINTSQKKAGTASASKNYQKGNWHLIQFVDWSNGITFDPDFKTFSVWIRGASQDYTLYLTTDTRAIAFGNSDQSTPLEIPANTWKFFELPVSALGDRWTTGVAPLKQIGFWIKGPDAQDETFYFDNLLIFK
ncbi:MAG: IPT/TIG domain-containing protein [Bacteroidota bacterium]